MTDRELMQQALDALKVMRPACFAENTLKTADAAITALIDRLAQPQRQWVGLTEDEVSQIIGEQIGFNSCWGPEEDFAKAIEAKLKEKNT